MNYRGWFALSLLFLVLGAGYLAWWKWTAIPPATEAELKEVSGTLLKVEDISRSAGPVHPVLDVLIARADGGRIRLVIRNRDVTLRQFRALADSEVRARYNARTRIVYEFFTGDRQLVTYEESYRQALETYGTLKGAAKLVFIAGAVFGLIGLIVYFRTRNRSRS